VCENLDVHRGILDGRENGQGAVALGEDDEVDGEDAFEQLRPNSCGPVKSTGQIFCCLLQKEVHIKILF